MIYFRGLLVVLSFIGLDSLYTSITGTKKEEYQPQLDAMGWGTKFMYVLLSLAIIGGIIALVWWFRLLIKKKK